jgi:hypothetical protein
MLTFNAYVSGLSEYDRQSILSGYDELAKTGSTGDTPFRWLANEYLSNSGLAGCMAITSVMSSLANATFQYYTEQYFKERNNS